MTKDDVAEMLDSIDQTMVTFDRSYERALASVVVKHIDRPAVKSCMEHIRSCFDYMAVAINVAMYGKTSSNWCPFPWGKDDAGTQSKVLKTFPSLDSRNGALFTAVCSAQSFTGPTAGWMTTLFDICNQKKHVHLVQQARKDRFAISLPLHHFSPGSIVSIHGVEVDGYPIDHFEFNQHTTMAQVDQQLAGVPHINHLQKVEFRINSSNWDVRDLLLAGRDSVARTSAAVFREIV